MIGLFYLKFFLTNILFSLIIGGLLVRFNGNKGYTCFELMLYSMGLGPVFTVLMLYYLLQIIPHRPHSFYPVCIFLVYVPLFIFSIRGFKILLKQLKAFFKSTTAKLQTLNSREKVKKGVYLFVVLALLAGFFSFYPANIFKTPVDGHDALIYGNFGKRYYQGREVSYSKITAPGKNGFTFLGSQKPSFSLLLTWEMMLNHRAANKEKHFDLYYRSVTGYYWLLIVLVQFLWLYRKNKTLALLGILVLLAGLQFFLMLINYHLDSFRLFSLLLSWIWLAYTIEKKDRLSFFLLGVFSGFTAFTHLIGLVVALANVLAFLIFYESGLKVRVLKTAVLALVILAFGAVHYLLEALYGSLSGFLTYISL